MKAIESNKFRIEKIEEDYEPIRIKFKNLETLEEFVFPITSFGEFKLLLNEAEEYLV